MEEWCSNTAPPSRRVIPACFYAHFRFDRDFKFILGSLQNRVYSTARFVFVPKTTTIARVSWFFRGLYYL